uniref:Uncharacterized protein n=1 Tax=Arundo donax TaxID=35708 RepID=A0A0A8XWN5_ARUDO
MKNIEQSNLAGYSNILKNIIREDEMLRGGLLPVWIWRRRFCRCMDMSRFNFSIPMAPRRLGSTREFKGGHLRFSSLSSSPSLSPPSYMCIFIS